MFPCDLSQCTEIMPNMEMIEIQPSYTNYGLTLFLIVSTPVIIIRGQFSCLSQLGYMISVNVSECGSQLFLCVCVFFLFLTV